MTPGELQSALNAADIINGPARASYDAEVLLQQAGSAIVSLHREAVRARAGWLEEVLCAARELLAEARPGKRRSLTELLKARVREILDQGMPDDVLQGLLDGKVKMSLGSGALSYSMPEKGEEHATEE